MTREDARDILGARVIVTYASCADWKQGKPQAAVLEFYGQAAPLYRCAIPPEDAERIAPSNRLDWEEVGDDAEGSVPYSTGDVEDLAKAAEYMGWAPSIVSILQETRD